MATPSSTGNFQGPRGRERAKRQNKEGLEEWHKQKVDVAGAEHPADLDKMRMYQSPLPPTYYPGQAYASSTGQALGLPGQMGVNPVASQRGCWPWTRLSTRLSTKIAADSRALDKAKRILGIK